MVAYSTSAKCSASTKHGLSVILSSCWQKQLKRNENAEMHSHSGAMPSQLIATCCSATVATESQLKSWELRTEASAILLSNAATTYNNKAMITDVAQHTQLTHSFTLIWKLEAGTAIDQFTQTTDDRIMYGRSVAQHVVIWHPNALVYGLFYCTLCWVIPCHYVRLWVFTMTYIRLSFIQQVCALVIFTEEIICISHRS